MIKASDLRIGNKFECMGMIQTVFEILDNTDKGRIIQKGYEHLILCKENGNQYKPIEISGIPLTEEWLLKFGFHYSEKGFYWKNWGTNGFQTLDYDTGYKRFRFELGQYYYKVLDYVHQLQNLYYALTGEELTSSDLTDQARDEKR
jgi:hypothetical protein